MTTDAKARSPLIVLGITGSIAAYKSAMIVRLFRQQGFDVQVVMTHSAKSFLGPTTMSGLSGRTVLDDMWDASHAGELHVSLAHEADAIVVAPATADLIARMASGRADDLLSALMLVAKKPCFIAPAMHPHMWSHPATQRNVSQVQQDGRVTFIGPVDGVVASFESGLGRMSEPEDIVRVVSDSLRARSSVSDLSGLHIVVTAGPTVEDIDPVRFISNRSTGKMGYAIANVAAQRGAQVTLVHGPTNLSAVQGVTSLSVRSALQMQEALLSVLGDDLHRADAVVMAAAVGDYRMKEIASKKAKKTDDGGGIVLELVRNPDVLSGLGQRRDGRPFPMLVGFAVETENLVAYAQKKRAQKKVDLVVANLAAHGFGTDVDEVIFVSENEEHTMCARKEDIAMALCNQIRDYCLTHQRE